MKQKEDVELRGLSVRLYSGTHSLDLLGILQVSILTFRSPGPDGPTRYRYWAGERGEVDLSQIYARNNILLPINKK